MTDNENISQNMHVSRKCSTIAITFRKESLRFYTLTDLQCSPQGSAIACILSPKTCMLLPVHLPQHYLPISLLWYVPCPEVSNVMSSGFSWSVLLAKIYIQPLVICLHNITKGITSYYTIDFNLIKQTNNKV